MVESSDPCPKCGKYQWWYRTAFLSKDQKHLLHLSYCDACGTQFISKRKLVQLVGRKFNKIKAETKDTSRMGSPYNQFVKEKYAEGITDFKEIGRLWQEQKQKKQ